jgi:hypothetical protein
MVDDMQVALKRLAAVASGDSAAGLRWSNEGGLALCLAHEDGAASDVIAAATTGTGCVALSIELLTKTMTATRVKRLRLSVEPRMGAVARLDAPDDAGVVAIVAPMRWSAATSAAVA